MNPPAFRLTLCVALFGLWMGYLAYLVTTRPQTPQGTPLVVSGPQILASELDVVARVETVDATKDETEVTVGRVLSGSGVKEGDKIVVTGLARCRASSRFDGVAKGALALTPEGLARVSKADRPDDKDDPNEPRRLHVSFADGRSASFPAVDVVVNPDWVGEGDYLLPLRPTRLGGEAQPGRYEVVPVPPSPGFERPLLRAYPATAEALAQYAKVRKPG